MSVKMKIKRVRKALTWDVELNEGEICEITSDPFEKKHVISLPSNPNFPVRDIEILHEYVHALYAEQVHHLFSTSTFHPETDVDLISRMVWVFKIAPDWFIEAKLFQIATKEETEDVLELYDSLQKMGKLSANQLFPGPSMTAAQKKQRLLLARSITAALVAKYTSKEVQFPVEGQQIVEAFLKVEPLPPSISKLKSLINNLLCALSLPFEVSLNTDTDIEVWEIREVPKN